MSNIGNGTARDGAVAGPSQVLSVYLERAFNLKPGDFIPKQDHWCVLKCASKEEKSLTVKGGRTNPVWNQTFTFCIGPNDHMLYVEIFSRDFLKREVLLGYANVPLAEALQTGKAKMLVPVFMDEERTKRHGSLELDLEVHNSPNRHSTPAAACRPNESTGPSSPAYTLNLLNTAPHHNQQTSVYGTNSDACCSNLTGVTGASHSPLFNDPRRLHHSSDSMSSFNAWQLEHSLSNISSASVEDAGEAPALAETAHNQTMPCLLVWPIIQFTTYQTPCCNCAAHELRWPAMQCMMQRAHDYPAAAGQDVMYESRAAAGQDVMYESLAAAGQDVMYESLAAAGQDVMYESRAAAGQDVMYESRAAAGQDVMYESHAWEPIGFGVNSEADAPMWLVHPQADAPMWLAFEEAAQHTPLGGCY